MVVPLKHTRFTIETKKWIAPREFSGEQSQLNKLKQFTRKPVLLVAFRHHGKFAQLRKDCVADYLFTFSSPSHNYPAYDRKFKTDSLISGQLLDLCETIDGLLSR